MATANLFEKARTVVPSPKSKLKAALMQRVQLNSWEIVARCRAMKNTLDAVLMIYEGQVKQQAKAIFIAEGLKRRSRPAAIEAKDGIAEGQVILGKRRSNQPLTPEHIPILDKHKITYETRVLVQECYRFNPKYTDDQKLLAELSKKISTIKGIPADLIEKQPGETTLVTTETTLDEIFRLKQEVAETLFDIVGNVSCKPVIKEKEDEDPVKAFKRHIEVVMKSIQ